MARSIVERLPLGEPHVRSCTASPDSEPGVQSANAGLTLNQCCNDYNPDPRILRVLHYIDNSRLCLVSIEHAARLVNLSVSGLRHLFKRSTAMSFHQYVRFSRLQRARKLLLESPLQVKQIAASIGVTEMSHFIRDYRFVYGGTPTEYRRQHAIADAITRAGFAEE